MTYSVHQSWDKLRVCAVGRSFPPEYFSNINNTNIRYVLERIAIETEEDYQNVIRALESFQVKTIRTDLNFTFRNNTLSGKQFPPPMTPRDHMAMIGDKFYMPSLVGSKWNTIKGSSWPINPPMSDLEFNNLEDSVLKELETIFNITNAYELHDYDQMSLKSIYDLVSAQGNEIIYDKKIDSAMVARVGKDLYFGTWNITDLDNKQQQMQELFPEYRCHVVNTLGHLDGTFCVVKPGLVVSSHYMDVGILEQMFPGWEVYYLEKDHITDLGFLEMKGKNQGKWYVSGEEQNAQLIDYVETYINNWLGFVEETTIDVNMLVIDESNVLCIKENPKLFQIFAKHGITPHVVDFRHYKFWDGGLHCITNDLDRSGTQIDYFPERSLT